ncbi:MAG: hypothetical protein KatS3mg011_1084 [Acidimicrobiia bacterium]|nr:MAG: hypothetical protein KatS3mg011_1084 [Acidimicrobiia bacterium]
MIDDRLRSAAEDVREAVRALPGVPPPTRRPVRRWVLALGVAVASIVVVGLPLLLGPGVPSQVGPASAPTTAEPPVEPGPVVAPESFLVVSETTLGISRGEDTASFPGWEHLVAGAEGVAGVEVGPDGYIGYVGVITGTNTPGTVYQLDLVSGGLRELTGGLWPAVSPDGDALAVVVPTAVGGEVHPNSEDVLVIDLDAGTVHRISAPAVEPELIFLVRSLGWIDDRTLAFETVLEDGSEVWIVDVDADALTDGTRLEAPQGAAWARPAPKGGRLAVVEQTGGLDPAIDPTEFTLVEVDPSSGERLTVLTALPGRPYQLDFDPPGRHGLIVLEDGRGGFDLWHWDGLSLNGPLPVEGVLDAAW